jgi:predicted component of type VI protein secretion system
MNQRDIEQAIATPSLHRHPMTPTPVDANPSTRQYRPRRLTTDCLLKQAWAKLHPGAHA